MKIDFEKLFFRMVGASFASFAVCLAVLGIYFTFQIVVMGVRF